MFDWLFGAEIKQKLRKIDAGVAQMKEDRGRYRRALKLIAGQSDEALPLDPTWAKRVAQAALAGPLTNGGEDA